MAVSLISGSDLAALLDDTALYLVDVREPDEVAEWSIVGAHNYPLGSLNSQVAEIPRDKELVVICAKGARALRGAEILAEHGLASRVLDGGMGSWSSTYDHVSGEFAGATVVQVRRRGKGCLSYVIGAGERAVVIDPSLELHQYFDVANSHGWTITHVLDTHLHADHLSGARELAAAAGAALWLNPADPFRFDFEPLVDGKSIELVKGVDLRVSFAPE
jgi:rhodanese-related sulfurtransferase